jgi:peroxiredoxin
MGVILAPLVLIPAIAAEGPSKPATPREQYEALTGEFQAATAAWQARTAGVGPKDPAWIKNHEDAPIWTFAPRLVAFAEANPEAPEAVDALLQIVRLQRTGRVSDKLFFPLSGRCLNILINRHLEDEKVIRECFTQVSYGAPGMETYFRALLVRSRDRELLGRSCMALVRCHERRLQLFSRGMFDSPGEIADLAAASAYMRSRLDPEFVRYVRTADEAVLSEESEALLERVVNEFADIPLAPRWAETKAEGRTLGEDARVKLEALRSLPVGKVAPEIEGEDIDGRPMKLSDHRGKVVVVVFWGMWCPPCRGMIAHEKALVEQHKDRPFALVGINSDSDREKLKADIAENGITWRSWWDDGKPGGPIATRWDVHLWPSVFVLDETGVIRFKRFPHSVPDRLDAAVDSLLKGMER